VKSSLLGWTPLAGKNESIPHLTTFTQWRDILEEESNQFILQPGTLSHINKILKGLFFWANAEGTNQKSFMIDLQILFNLKNYEKIIKI